MDDERDGFIGPNVTVVAVDKDKHSQHALKWALDNLVDQCPYVLLVHVIQRSHSHLGFANSYGMEMETEMERNLSETIEMQHLLRPLWGLCARKGVQVKDIILEDSDVSNALVDFIANEGITKMVLGASNRNAIMKKFRAHDVPHNVVRSASDFCSIYVISKTKVMSIRPASRPLASLLKHDNSPGLHPRCSLELDSGGSVRTLPKGASCRALVSSSSAALLDRRSFERNSNVRRRETYLETAVTSNINASFEDIPIGLNRARESLTENIEFQSFGADHLSNDLSLDGLDQTLVNDPENSSSSQSLREVEDELKRLKLELKQTMDMYSKACKEAVNAKQKAHELHKCTLEEARRLQEARLSEEAALVMVEMEKAKCRAALEAAETAQKNAEKEAQKRKNAEMRAKRAMEEKIKALDKLTIVDNRYRKYTINEIEVATGHFAEELKIGEGGYGPVYRGILDHTPVAIKVLRPDAAQGRRQFQQEVEVLSTMRHPNLVLLLGACPEYGCLVYEYMDNGSLEDRLFRRCNTPPIPWPVRFKIAAEIATALLFLHQTKPEPLVHRDLKPANILLDRNYTSKISDVGLSRLLPSPVADSVTQYRFTSTAGTFCYIDPEYQQTGMLGIESDIYSFGVLLLQIITAKPPMGLTHHVERAIEKGTFSDILDSSVPDWPVEETLVYAKMALKCAELRRRDRPDLATVVFPELKRLRDLGIAHECDCSTITTTSSSSSSILIHVGGPQLENQQLYWLRQS